MRSAGVISQRRDVTLTTLLRDEKGVAVPNVPMTLIGRAFPDGVEYRRAVVQTRASAGRSLSFPMISSARPAPIGCVLYGSEAPSIVRQLPGRRLRAESHGVRSGLADGQISQTTPAEVTVDGRFLLWGAASNLGLERRSARRIDAP